MKTFIGVLVVAGYILLCHPEWLGPLLIAGAWGFAFLIFRAFSATDSPCFGCFLNFNKIEV